MKVTNIWAGKDIIVSQSLDRATNKMSSLTWREMFSNDIHPMHIEHNIACNTAAKPGATDKSMSELIERCGTDAEALNKKHLSEHLIRFPFSSKRKRMSTILENIETGNSYKKRLHIKGASEIVKNCCSHYLDADGKV
jgi:magnesium-transporting ATPase (P-type)